MRNINNSDNRINVDSRNYSTIARFRQEDDATLVVNLFKNGSEFDVSNQTITLRALRLDGQSVNQTDNITKNKNIVTINLRRNILAVIGRTSIQLNISDSAGQFTTAEFFIEVEKNNLGHDTLKGSDNVQALQQILIDFKAEKSSLIKNITDDYNSLKKIIIDQNQAANLQNQINQNKQQSVENTNRIEQLEDLTPVWQEQVGTGRVTINDSFDGITKDLVVKGVTLNNLVINGSIKKDIGASSNSRATYKYSEKLKYNTVYTVVFEIEGKTDENRYYVDLSRFEAKGVMSETKNGLVMGKITTKDTGNLDSLTCYYTSNGIGNGAIKNVMVFEGDLQYIPSTYFDSIASSGEQEDNKIKIKSVGKNLVKEVLFPKGIDTTTGNIGNGSNNVVDFIKVKPNTQYVFSRDGVNRAVNKFYYKKDKSFIKRSDDTSYTFTVPDNCYYIRLTFGSTLEEKIQLEEGSVATNYEQFRSKSIEIPLPFAKGLKSTLDNSVYDEINGNTGEIIQRVSDEYTALAKPIIHKITDVQLATFDETTHITQENNILSDISFKAKVSLSSQAKRLTEENKALKEENRELREDTNTIVDSLISVFEPMLLPNDDAGEEQKIILEKLYEIRNR